MNFEFDGVISIPVRYSRRSLLVLQRRQLIRNGWFEWNDRGVPFLRSLASIVCSAACVLCVCDAFYIATIKYCANARSYIAIEVSIQQDDTGQQINFPSPREITRWIFLF